MIHPYTELRFISDEVGYGVVATRRIPKGTITWALDKLDRIFAPDEVEDLGPIYRSLLEKYAYRNRDGDLVLCWDHARFVNHSFRSNCLTTAYEFELAVRDIEAGEELTDDYGYLNVPEPFECVPERGSRRKCVYPDDLLRYHKSWDGKLRAAFGSLLDVEQPLMEIVPLDARAKAIAIAAGREKMDSILTCYYSGSSIQLAGNGDLFSSERAIPGGMEVPPPPPVAGRGAFARPAPAGAERQSDPYRL